MVLKVVQKTAFCAFCNHQTLPRRKRRGIFLSWKEESTALAESKVLKIPNWSPLYFPDFHTMTKMEHKRDIWYPNLNDIRDVLGRLNQKWILKAPIEQASSTSLDLWGPEP